jgi:hypothetical protein
MKRLMLLTFTVLLAGSAGQSKPAPAELKWIDSAPPGLPAGATFAVVKGDPAKKAMFTIRARMPSNYAVPPHWHPTDEKVTLISGKMAYGMSDRVDRANAQALVEPGQDVVMKAKMHHWVYTGDGAEIEVTAMGPFAITYVNPGDDPRPKK